MAFCPAPWRRTASSALLCPPPAPAPGNGGGAARAAVRCALREPQHIRAHRRRLLRDRRRTRACAGASCRLRSLRDAFARPHPIVTLLRTGAPTSDVVQTSTTAHTVNSTIHIAPEIALLMFARSAARCSGAARATARGMSLSDEACAPRTALVRRAALFAAHPLQVEAVASDRAGSEPLAALGTLRSNAVLSTRSTIPDGQHARCRGPRPGRARCWRARLARETAQLGCRSRWAAGRCGCSAADPARAFARRSSIALGLCVAAAVLWMTVRNTLRARGLQRASWYQPAPGRLSLVQRSRRLAARTRR